MTYNLPLPYKSQAKNRRSNALMSMNVSRNLHYRALNNFKQAYQDKIILAIPYPHPVYTCVSITYTMHLLPTKGNPTKLEPHRGSKPRNLDMMNILATVDKVNLDALVHIGVLPDDTITHVQQTHFRVNPYATEDHIEVHVEEITPQPDPRKETHEKQTT